MNSKGNDMINQTVRIRRADWTKNGYTMTSSTHECTVHNVASLASGKSPYCELQSAWATGQIYTFSINTGWGEKPVRMYRIEPEDLERLRSYAKDRKLKVAARQAGPNPGRRGARRPKKKPPEQLTFWGETARE